MIDYNLHGLSTRSFEQMIQALALQEIGPSVTIFGDGPDGGREATYEGSMDNVQGCQGKNNIYCVIQAKFKQKSVAYSTGTKWVLDELKKEMEKFSDPNKNLRKPEVYIFATNLPLSSVHETGGKDKTTTLMQEFKKQLPIKQFIIWDQDQICRMLDNHREIRHTFGAWITPGDVLAAMLDWIEDHKQRTDFGSIVTDFLANGLHRDLNVRLSQAGSVGDKKTRLAQVFVDLPAFKEQSAKPPKENKPLPPGVLQKLLEIGNQNLTLPTQNSVDEEKTQNSEPGRVVLIGGPGQGKSTIGQFLEQIYRAALLKEKKASLLSEEKEELISFLEHCESENINLPLARRFPLRIELKEFARELANHPDQTLLGYLEKQITKLTDHYIHSNNLGRWLQEYPWVVIFDGLDEVPASSNRDQVLEVIRRFRRLALKTQADIFMIATTRPQGYNNDLYSSIFQHLYLAPLSTNRAFHYGKKLIEVRYDERKEILIERLEQAVKNEATRRLMESPLQVTILTALLDKTGSPPRQRWRLFSDYYRTIYQRELEKGTEVSDLLRDHEKNMDAIHHQVGLILQVMSEQSGETDALLTPETMTHIVKAQLEKTGQTGKELERLLNQILKAAMERLVFLVNMGKDRIGFELRSLQEFMAAEALMSGQDKLVGKRLEVIAPHSHWRNVFLFAAGHCYANRDYLLDDVIDRLCRHLDENSDSAYITIKTGSRLALDLLVDGSSLSEPNYHKSLARLALRLANLPPENSHDLLATRYDKEISNVYQEVISYNLTNLQPTAQLGTWRIIIGLIRLNIPWAIQVADKYWPTTASELRDIYLAVGDHAMSSWLAKKMVSNLWNTSPYDIMFTNSGIFDSARILLSKLTTNKEKHQKHIKLIENLTLANSTMHGIDISIPEVNNFKFNLVPCQTNSTAWTTILSNANESHSEWSLFLCAARFNANPSAETLAYVLRWLASRLEQYDSQLIVYRMVLPWPLATCLDSATSQQELLHLAEAVDSGALGDTHHWLAAENRWKNQNFQEKDFQIMNDMPWPFDDKIEYHGIPTSGLLSTWIHSGDSLTLINSIEKLAALLQITSSNTLQFRLVNIIQFIISVETNDIFADIMNVESPPRRYQIIISEWLQSLSYKFFSSKPNYTLYLNLLALLPWNTWSMDIRLDFFDTYGQLPNLRIKPNFSNKFGILFAKTIIQDFAQVSEVKIGLLRIMGLLTTIGIPVQVDPKHLNPDSYNNKDVKRAVLWIQLTQGNWNDSEAQKIAKHIVELNTTNNPIFINVFDVLDKNNIPDNSLEIFLIALSNELASSSHWQAKGDTISRLQTLLDRRQAGLHKPENHNHLIFPPTLAELGSTGHFRNTQHPTTLT